MRTQHRPVQLNPARNAHFFKPKKLDNKKDKLLYWSLDKICKKVNNNKCVFKMRLKGVPPPLILFWLSLTVVLSSLAGKELCHIILTINIMYVYNIYVALRTHKYQILPHLYKVKILQTFYYMI